MVSILNIFFIAVGLSMDAFALSIGCAIANNQKSIFLLPLFVGFFHFFMPLIGSAFGQIVTRNIEIDLKYFLFIVLIILSIDMLVSFFEKKAFDKKLCLINIIILSLSVSIDSLTLGIGLKYLYSNVIISIFTFSLVSFSFTWIGITLGKVLSKTLHNYAYLFGSLILFIYSIIVLTK